MNRTASNPPPLIASRVSDGGGEARTVRYAVTSSTSQPSSMRLSHQGLGGDVGARQEHPVDRVEDRVVGRPVLQQPGRRLLARGDQVRLDAEVDQRAGGLFADRGDLDPGEGAGVEPVLLELLPDRLDRVHAGEGDPLVPAGDQALDRALHLLGRTRRLDGDRRDLVRHRAVGAELVGERRGLLLRPGDEDLPAEHRLRLEPRELIALGGGAALSDHGYDRPVALGRREHLGLLEDLGDRPEGRRPGALAGGGARDRHGERGVGLAARRDQLVGRRPRPRPAWWRRRRSRRSRRPRSSTGRRRYGRRRSGRPRPARHGAAPRRTRARRRRSRCPGRPRRAPRRRRRPASRRPRRRPDRGRPRRHGPPACRPSRPP